MPSNKKLKRFTYGHQFEPAKFSLVEIVQLCKDCEPERNQLEANISVRYFSSHSKGTNPKLASENISKLAMNCFLSLRAYKLIEDLKRERQYRVTDLANEILGNAENTAIIHRLFAAHILNNLSGMALLKAIEAINARGEQPQLETIAYELQERGYSVSPNAIYPSTMRSWLSIAGVFEREYEINWDVVSEILGINQDFIDELYTLTPGQKHFLLSLLNLDVKEFTPANKVAEHTRSIYKVKLTTKNLINT